MPSRTRRGPGPNPAGLQAGLGYTAEPTLTRRAGLRSAQKPDPARPISRPRPTYKGKITVYILSTLHI